jgi:hypothetical protein
VRPFRCRFNKYHTAISLTISLQLGQRRVTQFRVDIKAHYEKISEAARLVRQDSLLDLARLQGAHTAIEEIRLWQGSLAPVPRPAFSTRLLVALR